MKRDVVIHSIFVLFIGLFGVLPTVYGAAGDLDLSFSNDGKVIDNVLKTANAQSNAIAVQADGKIVIAGTITLQAQQPQTVCGIVRYNSNGLLDTTFDEDGRVVGRSGTTFSCRALAIQPDGKIIVAGNVGSGSSADFALMRFNTNGSPDSAFGSGGIATASVSAHDAAHAIAIQADGKIVAVGDANDGSGSNYGLARFNVNGSLDNTFDGDGKVVTDFNVSIDRPNSVAIQADGKIIAAGYYAHTGPYDFSAARYNTDGSLDTTFDQDGKVTTNISLSPNNNGEQAFAVAVQADGKIVLGGYSTEGEGGGTTGGGLALVRYNPTGSLDTSFDGNGIVVTNLGTNFGGGSARTLAIQPDGKIIAAGGVYNNGTRSDFAAARYNADGSLDTSFDGDGKLSTDFANTEDSATALAIQPDGKITVTGLSGISNLSTYDFALLRYQSDGSLDTSFNSTGKTTIALGFPITADLQDVAIQPDGKIVAAGYGYNGSNADFAVVRYNADGTPDPTFSSDGSAITDITIGNAFGDRANAVAIQSDGKIIAAGYSNDGAVQFALVRYNPDGSLDTSFDQDGMVKTNFSSNAYLYDVAIQADGKIVAAGYLFLPGGNSQTDIAVARYNADGSLDTSFDADGKLTTDFSNSRDEARSVAIQTDGKIVVAGSSYAGSAPNDCLFVRYNADGSLDTSFDVDGKLLISVISGNDGASSVLVQPDGKIVAGGGTSVGGNSDFAIVRLNPTGALDTTFDSDGTTTTNIFTNDFFAKIALQPDGKIIAAGNGFAGNSSDAVVVRYNADGSLDTAFSGDGIQTINMISGTSNETINGIALDSLGRIVVAGRLNSDSNIIFARLLGDSAAPDKAPFDFDGDGKTDVGIFRSTLGEWWINRSSLNSTITYQFGNSTDKIAPGDFTGDGKTDVAIFRPSNGTWYILRSEDLSFYAFPFGTAGDVPVAADFDGDGKADAAVYRPSNFVWYIQKSSGGTENINFGASGDVPVPADYDGDGKTDIAITRLNAGRREWWIRKSSDAQSLVLTFGTAEDKAVPGDYTGDGKADAAFFRPSNGSWYILRSENVSSFYSFPFGTANDIPAPGDYDGDGKFDAVVFRPSNSIWYQQRTTQGFVAVQFGNGSDTPIPSAFAP